MKARVLIALSAALSLNLIPGSGQGQTISTVAGCGIGNDSLATKAEVIQPSSVVRDNAGNIFIADVGNNMIRKVDPTGVITTFAGNGKFGYTGDGGPATAAAFGAVTGLALDKFGNLFITDNNLCVVRQVNTSGIISTIAGIAGSPGYSGEGLAATVAQINNPNGIAADTAGNIYIADFGNGRVRKINPAGIVTTFAGNGTSGAPVFGGLAFASSIGTPVSVATDKRGNVFVGAYSPMHIMKINSAGILSNLAGTGSSGSAGDGGPATAATFSTPTGLALDTAGNIFFSDVASGRIRAISATTGIISGAAGSGITGFTGDGGPATSAELSGPEGLFFDVSNNLYVADYDNSRIRLVNTTGTISTFAGQNGLFSEGYSGINSEMASLGNLATDAAGNLYIVDLGNDRIRMLSALTGKITTVAGAGVSGYYDPFSGDGGPATQAHLYNPSAVVVDATGNLIICDQNNQRIRKVTASSGTISTIAGDGVASYFGNGTSAFTAEFRYPTGIAIDASNNIYVADFANHRIRKISSASGNITTLAGNGVAGDSGDGLPATLAELNYPHDVAVDAAGNVYFSDLGNNRIRMINTAGIMSTIAGNGIPGNSGDGGPATAAQLAFPEGIKIDASGNIFIADNGNNAVRMINTAGIITTLAGTGDQGFSGDGGPALAATLDKPYGIAIDLSGNLYISDAVNYRVRKINISSLSAASVRPALPGVLIYPNPTKGTLNIVNASNCDVVVDDAAGRQVMHSWVTTAKETLDISHLSTGVYLVKVINKNGQEKTVKVTKY